MSAETLEACHKQRYREREVTCKDCGVVFVAEGRRNYCPKCFTARRAAAAHKCHAVRTSRTEEKRSEWNFLYRRMEEKCRGSAFETCEECVAEDCSKRPEGRDYDPEFNYHKAVSC